MPKIRFRKAYPEIEVADGANLMASLLAAGMPVASSCNSDGVCAKCGVKIIEGASHLSEPGPTEIFLKEKNNIRKDFRISCQVFIHGDIVIDAGYW